MVLLVGAVDLSDAAELRALPEPPPADAARIAARPATDAVDLAVRVAADAAGRFRERPGDLPGDPADIAALRALGTNVERGYCTAADLALADAIAADAAAPTRLRDGANYVAAELAACRGDDDGAIARLHRLSHDGRLAGPSLRLLRALDATPAHVDVARAGRGAWRHWVDDALEGRADVDATIALLDRVAPARWLDARVEAARWNLGVATDRPDRGHVRAAWLRAHSEHRDFDARFEALLADPTGRIAAQRDTALIDAALDRAREAALLRRTSAAAALADRLLATGMLDEFEAGDLHGWLFGARDRGRLQALAAVPDRAGAEAAWTLILDARRDDRDDEALERTLEFVQRWPYVRTADALDACVRLAGAAGRLVDQRRCLERGLEEQVWAEPADLVVEAIADALAFGDVANARHWAELAEQAERGGWRSQASAFDDLRLRYWSARVALDDGDVDRALAGLRDVSRSAPLSWYAVQADGWLTALGDSPKLPAVVRTGLRNGGGVRPDPRVAGALELAALGMHQAALAEARSQAELFGADAFEVVSLAAELLLASGQRAEALWFLGRFADVARADGADVASLSPTAWQAAFPTPFDKQLQAAARATGIPRALLTAFARRESAFDPTARSGVGARGLIQLLPTTAQRYAALVPGLGSVSRSQLNDPAINARLSAEMLRDLEARYGGCREPMAVAYAAGPAHVERWTRVAPGVPADVWLERVPYPTVREYARNVVAAAAVYAVLLDEPPPPAPCIVTSDR